MAVADIQIDLRPAHPGPLEVGEVANVQAWFVDKDNGHPITNEDILFRGYQLDFTNTDGVLGLPAEMNLESDIAGINTLFPNLPRPSLIFPSSSETMFMMTLPAGGEMLVGDIDVTVNGFGWLDVVDAFDADENNGAWVRFGFGIDEDDPVITWRAFTGELNPGRLWVPEPGSILLLAVAGLLGARRRSRN